MGVTVVIALRLYDEVVEWTESGQALMITRQPTENYYSTIRHEKGLIHGCFLRRCSKQMSWFITDNIMWDNIGPSLYTCQ